MKLFNKTLHDLTSDVERSADWAIVAIDETSNWSDDIANRAGKIEGVYFVNLREPTNLCDAQINYPATFLYNIFRNPENLDLDNNESDLEFDNGGEEFRYIHEYTRCTELEPSYMPQSWFDEMKAEGEDWEESQIEYYRCNHVI